MVTSTSLNASVGLARAIASMHTILRTGSVIASGLDDQRYALGDRLSGLLGDSRADTAVGVVSRVALALVGARMTPNDACLDRRADDIEVGLNRRVATR